MENINVTIERFTFMNDFDEYVDEDNIDEVLHKAVEEIKTAIEGDQDKNGIMEYKPFILG